MAIYIGSARIDENDNSTGGSAGDQTGKEVSTQTMYTHSKGWYILRPKSVTHANAIAKKMQAACDNDNIGYDQNNRLGIITYGISTTTKTECDCSSLVRECVKEATGTDPGNFTTANEATKLASTGLFEDKIAYSSQSSTPVHNGDILVTKTKGHTVIVVSGNARSKSTTTSSGTSSTVSSSDAITVDGAWGQNTTKKAQSVFGTTKDGYVSGQRTAYKKYLTAASTASWKFQATGSSELIKAIQTKTGTTADGIAGPATVKALQTFLGVTVDGYMGTKTVKAFQTWLNKQ